ncbi:unnamed protein product, partial [Closterium sp. Naga37s-1]
DAKVGKSDSPVLLMPPLPLLPVLPVAPVLPAVPGSAGRSTVGGRRRRSAAEYFGSGGADSRACGRGAGACERAKGGEDLECVVSMVGCECGARSTACEGARPTVCSAFARRGSGQGNEVGRWRDGGNQSSEGDWQTKGRGGTEGGGERGKAAVAWDRCAVSTVRDASASTAAIPPPAVARITPPPAVSPPEATSSLHQPCFLESSQMECAERRATMGCTAKAGRDVPGLARGGTESSRARGGYTRGTQAELHAWQCAESRSERHVGSRSRSVTPEPSAGDLDLCVDRCLAMIGGAEDRALALPAMRKLPCKGAADGGCLGLLEHMARRAAGGSFPAAANGAAGAAAGGGGGGALFGDVGRVAFARHKEMLRAAGRRGHWQE